ncbi:IS66 family insertion sequence element accessory protein TnpB [Pedobacter sp. MC2016-05]|uniref:IS66 family insertion sequence element accessory protein TnpA n=1 Tax=Pedobacter sp. MC2016-05 TaxID=2994474 RepID=UPI002246C076|nr:IS66 family insertion sequence element accessory protein TnpB [Pedobacter sp. MC2016-05]MCX2476710.1 IS66 family insertion sequence element accessory protein TnpB [Pedobacter sp. MC2016-05]
MRTSEEKMLAVEAWRTSGLSQNEYCKTLGVKRTTFANWVSRNRRKKAVPNFVRVTIPPVTISTAVEVVYPNGVIIKAPGNDLKMLSHLIKLY